MNKKTAGVLFGLSAAFIWGIEAIFVRFSTSVYTVTETLGLVLIFSIIPPLLYVLARKRNFTLTGIEFKYCLILGLLGTALPSWLYYYGLSTTFILNVLLVIHTQPFFILVIGYFLFKEKLNRYDYLSGLLLFGAAVLVIARTTENLFFFSVWRGFGCSCNNCNYTLCLDYNSCQEVPYENGYWAALILSYGICSSAFYCVLSYCRIGVEVNFPNNWRAYCRRGLNFLL